MQAAPSTSPALEIDYEAIAREHECYADFIEAAERAAFEADPSCARPSGPPSAVFRELQRYWTGAWRTVEDARLQRSTWETERQRRIRISDVPLDPEDTDRLLGWNYDREAPALKALEGWRLAAQRDKRIGRTLILASNPGVGKTFAAAHLLHNVRYKGRYERIGRFVTMPKLVAMRLNFKRQAECEDLLATKPFLVIDELCTELTAHDRRAAAGLLVEVFNERARAGCWTVMLTNLPEAAMLAHYTEIDGELDERLRDRIRHRAVRHWVKGPSLRRGVLRVK